MLHGSGQRRTKNTFIYLAALCTLVTIAMAEIVDDRPFPYLRYLALPAGALSLLFIFWPMVVLHHHGGAPHGSRYMEATRVVTRGPYALVRHPQYLGYMILNVTFMLVAQHWLVFLPGALALTLFYLQARREEAQLVEAFGTAYGAYTHCVPRFNLALGLARFMVRERSKNS